VVLVAVVLVLVLVPLWKIIILIAHFPTPHKNSYDGTVKK